MNPSSTQSCESRQAAQRRKALTDDATLWLVGLAITVVLIAALVGAIVSTTPTPRVPADSKNCPDNLANDEHASLVAFFQDPADQSVLLQSIRACSK
ncbi:hypothetical protein [Paraburkholderia susongensis]|uniref:Uncharacterized protein n=1 Tax=Paraburkholderia susongensis TaxID=1515439 RepID=A0A1X7LWT3_9BURK|nr:hypothetical protein [Paraburkholderia susongensis]SMG58356.1 hypothetical protein SAMN06265784_11129 [Paraburkholderia susongensis]